MQLENDLDPFLVCNPETEEDMNSLISDFLSTLIIPVCRLLAEKRPCLHISKDFSGKKFEFEM